MNLMGNVGLLSLKEKNKWTNYLLTLPIEIQDVYYTSEYYEIYEKHGNGKALCFVLQDGNNLAVYPFL